MQPPENARSDLAYAPPFQDGRGRLDRLRDHPVLRRVWREAPPFLPLLPFLLLVLAPPLNHDVAAVLQFSQRWLGGAQLYRDLIDVNPPLIFVLNLVPAALARWLHADPVVMLQSCLLTLGGACWALGRRVRDRASEGPAERRLLDVLPLLVLLDAGYDFGQRDHLMAIVALPYLFAAQRRALGELPPGWLAVALLGGVFFALKPHFLAVPGLVELWLLHRRGWRATVRDPLPWVMAAMWALYLATLPLLFPDYLGRVVPLVWGYYLDLGGVSVWDTLLGSRLATALLLLLALLWPGLRATARPLPALLALAGLGAAASALAQHKGWSYHILPIELFALSLGCLLAARWLDGLGQAPGRPFRPSRFVGVLVALCGLYFVSNSETPWKQLDYPTSPTAGLVRLLRQATHPGDGVLVLSPGIWPLFPALTYAGVTQTLPTMNLWLLQGVYHACPANGARYHDPAEMGDAERLMLNGTAADFAAHPPAALVIDRSPGIPWCGAEFDLLDYYSRNPVFAAAFAHYRLLGSADRYRVFQRVP